MDLFNDSLADPHRCRFFRDKETMAFLSQAEAVTVNHAPFHRLDASLEQNSSVIFDGKKYQVSLVGTEQIILKSENGQHSEMSSAVIRDLFSKGSLQIISPQDQEDPQNPLARSIANIHPRQLEEALQRLQMLDGTPLVGKKVSERTLRQWRQIRRSAPEGAASDLLSLVPKTNQRGNRNRKISQGIITKIEDILAEHFFSPENKKLPHCFKLFKFSCEEDELRPVSYTTFWKEAKRMQTEKNTRQRSGKRVAYAQSPHFIHLEYRTPVHGVRPWEICHIDHTELDIELICSRTGKVLGRPWLTLAMDAFSRRILGLYLSFEPPSYRSCMMVIRDIVRRYGRLPDCFVLDNGKEFKSRDFRLLAEAYGATIRYRPAARARFGSVLERLFGVANQEFVHNLAGNTQVTKHVRTVTKSINPKNLAEWHLEAFYFAFEYWATELYDNEEHPSLFLSPRTAFERGIRTSGQRKNRLIRYDRDFQIFTCPSAESGTRKIQKTRGVQVLSDYYWCEEFKRPSSWEKSVDVKVDPWDIRICFAWVDGEWRRCLSKHYGQLGQISLMQLRAYSSESQARKRSVANGDKAHVTSQWIRAFDPKNFEDALELRQAAMQKLYTGIGMGAVDPVQNSIPDFNQHVPSVPAKESTMLQVNAGIPTKQVVENQIDDEKGKEIYYELM